MANVACDGFRHFTAIEFARLSVSQSALSLINALDIERLGTRSGSRLIDFRILVLLRPRVPAEVDESTGLWVQILPVVRARIQDGMSNLPASISFVVHPAPQKPDPLRGHGHAFSL